MMNSSFMVDRAKTFVALLETKTKDNAEKIEEAYRLLYGRVPTVEEAKVGLAFVNHKTDPGKGPSRWQQYTQVLLSSNEFMHVE